jgi:hypothetical protein
MPPTPSRNNRDVPKGELRTWYLIIKKVLKNGRK